jgi:hypothetical protein
VLVSAGTSRANSPRRKAVASPWYLIAFPLDSRSSLLVISEHDNISSS